MKKYIALIIAAVCLFLAACADQTSVSDGDQGDQGQESIADISSGTSEETQVDPIPGDGNVRLTFAESIDMERIKQLEGRTVEMIGYMATVSPVSGEYLYLMNLPYQSCPYCVPNTQQLSNTIAVYAVEGERFEFTDGPINVIGKLETGDFSDDYGYTYNYRIRDAIYTEVNSSEASEKLALWEKLTNANISSDVYAMFDFVSFECNWPTYTAKFQDGEAYLYPADVEYFQKNQFKVEDTATYFGDLIKRSEDISDPVMDDLIVIIKDAQKLTDKAINERSMQNYTYDANEDRYTLNAGEELMNEVQDLYYRYATWLENFSLSN